MIARRHEPDANTAGVDGHGNASDDGDNIGVLGENTATDIRLYDASDVSWIALVLDCVMTCLGQPWRVLRERLEYAPIRADRVTAILAAMRRVMSGRAQRTQIARKVRSSVLGHPALDDAGRAERLAAAEAELGIDASELESMLWIDLADERPVALPDGRPDELRLAAFANVDRITRALRRARHVRIHAWGNAHPLIRTAMRYGLLVRVSSDDMRDAPTVIDIVGPLSLFHRTSIYGRTLGAIVPMLAGLDRFVIEIDADFGYGMAALRVSSPALLPPAPAERGKPSIAARIANALGRERTVLVEKEPPPLAHDRDRLFPDLAIEVLGSRREHLDRSRCWYVEVVGFATAEYVTAKLARYAAAGVDRVILVVDDTRAADLADLRRVVAYKSRTIVGDLLAIMEQAT